MDHALENPQTRRTNNFIVTSRIAGYEPETFDRYTHYTMLDLDEDGKVAFPSVPITLMSCKNNQKSSVRNWGGGSDLLLNIGRKGRFENCLNFYYFAIQGIPILNFFQKQSVVSNLCSLSSCPSCRIAC